MYLVHMFFNEAAILSGMNVPHGVLWRVPLLTVLVWICSFCTVRVLRRIPFMRRHFC